MLDVSDLIGIPYKDNGRDLNGLDCYGLALIVERRLGHNLRDIVYYNKYDPELSAKNIPSLNIKPTDYLSEGVLIEMFIKGRLHVGVALNDKVMIHATENQGVRISPIGLYEIKGMFTVWAE